MDKMKSFNEFLQNKRNIFETHHSDEPQKDVDKSQRDVDRLEKENLEKQIKIGNNILTLEFLIIDYVEHLEHHLKQIIEY